METAWIRLQDNINQSSCLDDIITAHNNYLEEILDRALLTSQHESLNIQIQLLLQSILRFCTVEESLIADAMASLARKRGNYDKHKIKTMDIYDDLPDTVEGVPSKL